MKYGYARVSTESQDLETQIERLMAAGCDRVFFEKKSGANANRPELNRMLGTLRQDDLVLAVVTDRIARDPLDLLEILRRVDHAGAHVKLLDEPFIDTSSELSDLVLFVVGWAAKWHRRRILENTAAGRARARARGVRFGRKPKLSAEQRKEVQQLLERGATPSTLAIKYEVSLSTVSRLSPRRVL